MDAFTWSIPFLSEKVLEMFITIFDKSNINVTTSKEEEDPYKKLEEEKMKSELNINRINKD